jgi:hypothetical protein
MTMVNFFNTDRVLTEWEVEFLQYAWCEWYNDLLNNTPRKYANCDSIVNDDLAEFSDMVNEYDKYVYDHKYNGVSDHDYMDYIGEMHTYCYDLVHSHYTDSDDVIYTILTNYVF